MYNNKSKDSGVGILDAIETLSSIADMEPDQQVDVGTQHNREIIIHGKKVKKRSVKWLYEADPKTTASVIKEAFSIVLHYLNEFYKKQTPYLIDSKKIDRIKAIMVIVGEAAKKLDRYTDIFKNTREGSVTNLKEYRKLQELYHKKINREIGKEQIGKWVIGLIGKKPKRSPLLKYTPKIEDAKHAFIDLDALRKDVDYELLFIRKADGNRFYNPKLIRNVKLVCDFGDRVSKKNRLDPLEKVEIWQDRIAYIAAKKILKSLGEAINLFYRDVWSHKKREIAWLTHKAIIALMLSANPKNLLVNNPIKSSKEYFKDFQVFLRKALHSNEYQKFISYPPKKTHTYGQAALEVVHRICRIFFVNLKGIQEFKSVIKDLLLEAKKMTKPSNKNNFNDLSEVLENDYKLMNDLMKGHPNGPLTSVLELMHSSDTFHAYDPVMQKNIPNRWFSIYLSNKKIEIERIPFPAKQEFINHVQILEEFKGFLREFAQTSKKHLIINLQDRTSWKEHARCKAIEELQTIPEFKETVHIITLPTNTDFYHQNPPYDQAISSENFISLFIEHIESKNTGFFIDENLKKRLFPKWIYQMTRSIHKAFFFNRNVLSIRERKAFIDIAYLLLTLKAIAYFNPDSLNFLCKDGIDISSSFSCLFFYLLKLLNKEQIREEDLQAINLMLYAGPLLIRERTMLFERFERVRKTIKVIEMAKHQHGENLFHIFIEEELGKILPKKLLQSKAYAPQSTENW